MICPRCDSKTESHDIKRKEPVPKGVNIVNRHRVIICIRECGWCEVKPEIYTLDVANQFFSVPRKAKKKVMVRKRKVAKTRVVKIKI